MKNQKMCYNISAETSREQSQDWLTFILSLPLDKKRELLKVLYEGRNNDV